MRFEKYLQEKYLGSRKSEYSSISERIYSIYKNPTKTEIKFVLEESRDNKVRFIADNLNKSVFVWASDLLHWEVWDKFLAKTFAKGRSKKFLREKGHRIISSKNYENALSLLKSALTEGKSRYNGIIVDSTEEGCYEFLMALNDNGYSGYRFRRPRARTSLESCSK